tara:strand:- start:1878 stop:2345 length:468 start_codon:yes stop_codon:yes gene_type:complete
MKTREHLNKLNLQLPAPFVYPNLNRKGCVVSRGLIFTSGHPPPENFGVKVRGKVGKEISEQEAYLSARATALNILASIEDEMGSLDVIKRVVKVTGMVNSAPGFDRQFAVIDGASDLFYKIYGATGGQHARSAIGMFELPRQFCMEIEAIFELID